MDKWCLFRWQKTFRDTCRKSNEFFIIGIGINVNNKELGTAKEVAVSLKNKTGKII